MSAGAVVVLILACTLILYAVLAVTLLPPAPVPDEERRFEEGAER